VRALDRRALPVVSDVSDPDAVETLADQVLEEFGRVDIVVNNAAAARGDDRVPVVDLDPALWRRIIDVNLNGTFYMSRTFGQRLVAQGEGGSIVNISSIGGKIGVAHLVPYCASKFALTGLSTAMRGELAKDNIVVTTVSPGLMRTGSPFNAWFKGRHREEFAWFTVADSLPVVTVEAARAARQIVDACRCGDPELVVTWPAKLAVIANAVSPTVVALCMRLTNALLPEPAGVEGDQAHSGWQSLSPWAPSRLTRPTERAAVENNQLSGASGPP